MFYQNNEKLFSWDMENPDGLPLGHGGDFEIDADHASPEVKEIVSEDDPEVIFFILSIGNQNCLFMHFRTPPEK